MVKLLHLLHFRLECGLFKKGDVVLEQRNTIGSETHKVEYNPKFIEFYEFLEELVSE